MAVTDSGGGMNVKVELDFVVTQLAHSFVSTTHYITVDCGYCSMFVPTKWKGDDCYQNEVVFQASIQQSNN